MQMEEIMRERLRNDKGFTLIEVIAVLIILSIIAVVVISRGGSSAEATLKSSAEALKGHIRFAQMKALNSDAPNCAASVGMVISSGGYTMFTIIGPTDCASANVVLPGAESSSGVNLPGGIVFTDTTLPLTFYFDRWGRPSITAPTVTTSTPADDNITMKLSHPSVTQPETITITKNTGFVP